MSARRQPGAADALSAWVRGSRPCASFQIYAEFYAEPPSVTHPGAVNEWLSGERANTYPSTPTSWMHRSGCACVNVRSAGKVNGVSERVHLRDGFGVLSMRAALHLLIDLLNGSHAHFCAAAQRCMFAHAFCGALGPGRRCVSSQTASSVCHLSLRCPGIGKYMSWLYRAILLTRAGGCSA